MNTSLWVKEFLGAITVCDTEGKIIEMNDRAVLAYEKQGGAKLLGANLLECHSPASQSKLKELMTKQQANIYTIEKKGVKKLVYQTPWYEKEQYGGFLEIVLELPANMPHFNRD